LSSVFDRLEGILPIWLIMQIISACPKGWRQWKKKCYRYYPKPALTFANAENYCNKQRGRLTSIHSDDEYDMLITLIK
jgi:hypothetical protein